MSSFLCFARALDITSPRSRLLWATSAGVAQAFLNATWEGSGLFSAVIAGYFLLKVLWNQIVGRHVVLYLGWATPGVLSLLFWTKTYHSLAPYALLAWGAPLLAGLTICMFFVFRYLRVKKIIPFWENFPIGVAVLVVTLALVITVIGIAASIQTVSVSDALIALWDNVQSPLGKSRLMRTVKELYSPYASDWEGWYGVAFLAIVVGSLFLITRVASSMEVNPWGVATIWLILLGGVLYSRILPSSLLGKDDVLSQVVFAGALLTFCISLIVSGWYAATDGHLSKRMASTISELWLLTLVWFLVMFISARGAQRYHFFFAPVASAFLAHGLIALPQLISERLFLHRWKLPAVLIALMCIGFTSWKFIPESIRAVDLARPHPSTHWQEAMKWMKTSLPTRSVVAAWWGYGSEINLLADHGTVIDEDHFIPYWIHLMARHVFCEPNPEVALSFLKTHEATHLAISLEDLSLLRSISDLGSDEAFDRRTRRPVYFATPEEPFLLQEGGYVLRFPVAEAKPALGDFPLNLSEERIVPANQWLMLDATLQFKSSDAGYAPVAASVRARTMDGKSLVLFPRRIRLNGQDFDKEDGDIPGTLVCFPPSDSDKKSVWRAFYVSEKMERFLSIRLLLLGQSIPSFHRVYPVEKGINLPPVGVWKIEYPPHILPRPEYLFTDFPNPALRRSWMRGITQ